MKKYVKALVIGLVLVGCSNSHTVPAYDEMRNVQSSDDALYREVWSAWWGHGLTANPVNDCTDGYEWHSTIARGYEAGTPKLVMPREVVAEVNEFEELCGEHDDNACFRVTHLGEPVIVLSTDHMGDPAVEREERAHAMLHWVAGCSGTASPEVNAVHALPGVWAPTKPGGDYVLRAFEAASRFSAVSSSSAH